MNIETKTKLLEAWQYCDDNDKSTEFMIEYMQDFAGVDFDCVIDFIEKTTDKERQNYIKTLKVKPTCHNLKQYLCEGLNNSNYCIGCFDLY